MKLTFELFLSLAIIGNTISIILMWVTVDRHKAMICRLSKVLADLAIVVMKIAHITDEEVADDKKVEE